MKRLLAAALVPALVLLADQLTKLWLLTSLPYGGRLPVIHGFFDLVHTRNRGVAFGLFSDGGPASQLLLQGIVAILVAFVAWQLWHHRHNRGMRIGLGLILGGALGNLLDRLLRGEVVDFLDFYLRFSDRAYHWPAFNLADAAITVGALVLLLQEAYTGKHAPTAG